MGRRPTGDKAMTAAERQRNRRARSGPDTPVDHLEDQLFEGPVDEVARWLVDVVYDLDRWSRIDKAVRARLAAKIES